MATSPSRDTAGRRRRHLLNMSRILDTTLGPDQSETVFDYADGWTIRLVDRVPDQQREGLLMGNCLADTRQSHPNTWSLRDEHNLPHLTFSVWQIESDDNLDEIPLNIGRYIQFLRADPGLFAIDISSRPVKPERAQQLTTYAKHGDTSAWERFPASSGERLRLLVQDYFRFNEQQRGFADCIVNAYARSHT